MDDKDFDGSIPRHHSLPQSAFVLAKRRTDGQQPQADVPLNMC